MSDDKIGAIRARHNDATWRYYELPNQMHDDRAFLLAEVEKLTGKLKLVADALNDTISKYHEVGDQADRLDAENERLRDQIYESIFLPKWQANELQREINQLRDAMQFYADPNRYKSTSVHMCGHSTGQSVMIDGGRKAREALGVKPRHTTQQSSS